MSDDTDREKLLRMQTAIFCNRRLITFISTLLSAFDEDLGKGLVAMIESDLAGLRHDAKNDPHLGDETRELFLVWADELEKCSSDLAETIASLKDSGQVQH